MLERWKQMTLPPWTAGRSVVPLRLGGAGTPLFCVHGLGGHVFAFLSLAMQVANERPVYGLQAQGVDPGQQPHDRIDTMASFYVDEIRNVQPRGPYLLAGWSLGGWIALEAAQQLTTAGEQVALVALFDTDWAVVDREAPALDDRTVLKWLAPHLNVAWSGLRRLSTDKLWDALAQRADLAEGGAADIRRLAEVCKAHLLAAARHRPAPYAGPTVLFRPRRGRPDKRWKTQCPQLVVHRVPGDHYSMLRPPHLDAWSEHLARLLASV